jgi:hypothetical protein
MAQIALPVAAFRDRQLPRVCVKTGGRAESMVAVWAILVPLWTWWLLPLGPLPFLLARWLLRRQVAGWLPMSRSAAARLDRVRRCGWLSLLVAVVSLVSGEVTGWLYLPRLGLGALAAAVIAGLVEPLWSVGARLDRSRDQVLLTRVHPEFCTAVEGSPPPRSPPAESARPS